ncbi:MAG: 3-deoxy-manno-octulosonate cytidylyltransferase [Burkholderiales bacterium]|nr:3-deoxy-manno-octulosonate cytidylyltransferase [Burkholderiales bacterium]
MRIAGVIPARMGSSRFPGKPLAPIRGIPMLGHVVLRSRLCTRLDAVYVATCDREIADYARSIGAPCLMTSERHERASDRCAEAATLIERAGGATLDVVVMIQGDEPMLLPSMIGAALEGLLADERAPVANLFGRIHTREALHDPNEIKVVMDRERFALYFSRAPIPYLREGEPPAAYKQVCVIPFRRAFLATFTELAPTPLEIAESIDMLRVLEHGYRVKMIDAGARTASVDTPRDLAQVQAAMKDDPLIAGYGTPR